MARSAFVKTVGYGFEAHQQADATAARVFISRTVETLLDCAGALLAVGLDEVFEGAVIARFPGGGVSQGGKHKLKDKQISRLAVSKGVSWLGVSTRL